MTIDQKISDGNTHRISDFLLPMNTEIVPNDSTPTPAPSENSAPIQLASSREIGPIGDSADCRMGSDGDTQPTEQPWPMMKKLAAEFMHTDLVRVK